METIETLVNLARALECAPAERQEAFCQLVLRLQDMAYGYAYALLGDAPSAQDAAQEAFIAAYKNLDQLREPGAFPGWLRRIVYTQCARQSRGPAAREQPIEASAEQLPEASAPGAPDWLARRDLAEELRAAMRSLPEPQRLASVLYYINGYSQEEVADFLEISGEAVKKRIQRARRQLQERMEDMVKANLQQDRPSRDDRLVQSVRIFAALREAAEMGELSTLELMLVDGVGADARDEEGQTLLHWAARENNLDAAALLLRVGANPSLPDHQGRTPLKVALLAGHHDIARLIRKFGGAEE